MTLAMTRPWKHPDNRSARTTTAWADWDTALESVENAALKDFVRVELAKNREARLRYGEVIYRIAGQRRFYLSCKRQRGYVWQRGRFDGDLAFWKNALSKQDDVKLVNQSRDIRFHLVSASDCAAFEKALETELKKIEFSEPGENETQPL